MWTGFIGCSLTCLEIRLFPWGTPNVCVYLDIFYLKLVSFPREIYISFPWLSSYTHWGKNRLGGRGGELILNIFYYVNFHLTLLFSSNICLQLSLVGSMIQVRLSDNLSLGVNPLFCQSVRGGWCKAKARERSESSCCLNSRRVSVCLLALLAPQQIFNLWGICVVNWSVYQLS